MSDLISRQAVENITWEEPSYSDPLNVLTEVREKVRALPSVENKGDLISRQAILNRTVNRNSIWNKITDSEGNNLEDILNSIPSAENKGEWIKYGVPRCDEQHYKCTSCGYYINFGQWGELYTKEFKFCPNCGAKMKGE